MADLGGKWAGGPQAALSGSYNGNASTVLVQLDAYVPLLDPGMNLLALLHMHMECARSCHTGA